MLYDKYKKTFQMYKENKTKLKEANVSKTDVLNSNNINRVKNNILSNSTNFLKNKINNLRK